MALKTKKVCTNSECDYGWIQCADESKTWNRKCPVCNGKGIKSNIFPDDDKSLKKPFIFYYDKVMSRDMKYPVITLLYDNCTHLLEGIDVKVPTKSKFNEYQPYFVMTGKANSVTIKNHKAIIQ